MGSGAQCRTIEGLILSKILKTWNQQGFSEAGWKWWRSWGVRRGEVRNGNVSREHQCT